MTACLFLLPFWHKCGSSLNSLQGYLLVWVLKRLPRAVPQLVTDPLQNQNQKNSLSTQANKSAVQKSDNRNSSLLIDNINGISTCTSPRFLVDASMVRISNYIASLSIYRIHKLGCPHCRVTTMSYQSFTAEGQKPHKTQVFLGRQLDETAAEVTS